MNVTKICAGIGCHLKNYLHVSNIEPADVDEFENTRRLYVRERGEQIFRQRQPSTGIYCIRSGHVLLLHIDAFEHKTAFKVVGPGELLGYRSFFGDGVHTATAQALTTCHVCWHPAATVHDLINNYPLLARQFLKELAQDRAVSDGLLLRGQKLSLRIRLIHLLLILKDRYSQSNPDGSLQFQLPLLRREIAVLLGTRAETVARTIKELEREGIACFKGRNVLVPDQDRLLELARMNPSAADGARVSRN